MSARTDEIAKYEQCYRKPEYRMGRTRAASVRGVVSRLVPGTLLDVGTGRGETLAMARQHGHQATGTEVVQYLLRPGVVYAEAHELPFRDGFFDHVTCFDVLEHLLEADLVPALREMQRVAGKTVTVSAHTSRHVVGDVDLHISARSQEAWDRLIRQAWGGGVMIGQASRKSYLWQWVR